jgi:hypothetical protein
VIDDGLAVYNAIVTAGSRDELMASGCVRIDVPGNYADALESGKVTERGQSVLRLLVSFIQRRRVAFDQEHPLAPTTALREET